MYPHTWKENIRNKATANKTANTTKPQLQDPNHRKRQIIVQWFGQQQRWHRFNIHRPASTKPKQTSQTETHNVLVKLKLTKDGATGADTHQSIKQFQIYVGKPRPNRPVHTKSIVGT